MFDLFPSNSQQLHLPDFKIQDIMTDAYTCCLCPGQCNKHVQVKLGLLFTVPCDERDTMSFKRVQINMYNLSRLEDIQEVCLTDSQLSEFRSICSEWQSWNDLLDMHALKANNQAGESKKEHVAREYVRPTFNSALVSKVPACPTCLKPACVTVPVFNFIFYWSL